MEADDKPMYDEFDSGIRRGQDAEAEPESPQMSEAAPPEVEAAMDAPPAPGLDWWTRVRRLLRGQDSNQFESRLRDLDRAIDHAPEAPSNYVLRAELYLEAGEYELAALDFRRALDIASEEVEQRDWGLVAQSVQDRAQRGLKLAGRKIRSYVITPDSLTQQDQ